MLRWCYWLEDVTWSQKEGQPIACREQISKSEIPLTSENSSDRLSQASRKWSKLAKRKKGTPVLLSVSEAPNFTFLLISAVAKKKICQVISSLGEWWLWQMRLTTFWSCYIYTTWLKYSNFFHHVNYSTQLTFRVYDPYFSLFPIIVSIPLS